MIKQLIINNKNKPLFYYTVNDKLTKINSEELNIYLKKHMGSNYTCKDFRTWSANILFIKHFLKNCKNKDNPKKIIIDSINYSANQLGHSKNICKKSYISNNLLDYCLDSFNIASNLLPSELLVKIWSL